MPRTKPQSPFAIAALLFVAMLAPSAVADGVWDPPEIPPTAHQIVQTALERAIAATATATPGAEEQPPVAALAPPPAETQLDPLTPLVELGGRIRRSRRLADETAAHVSNRADNYRDVEAEHFPSLDGDQPTSEAAELLGLTTTELLSMEVVSQRIVDQQRARDLASERLRDLQALADQLYRPNEPTRVVWPDTQPRTLRPLIWLMRNVRRSVLGWAIAEVGTTQREVALLESTVAYLERRRAAISATLNAASSPFQLQEIRAEISRDRRRLDQESRLTEQVEDSARELGRRAEAEGARAEQSSDARRAALAQEWSMAAEGLRRVASARRSEQAGLDAMTRRREAFLRQQAEIRLRVESILDSPRADVTRAERADRLYDEVFALRWEARERLSLRRQQLSDLTNRIPVLEVTASQARGQLDLALNSPSSEDHALRTILADVRRAQVELAENQLGLSRFQAEMRANAVQHAERQIAFYAQTADSLIDALSDERRDRVFEFTGRNLYEAQWNVGDRFISWGLLLADRIQRIDGLTTWLSGFGGLVWASKLLLILIGGVFLIRLLKRYRDRILVDGVLRRLDRYAWVQRHIRGVVQVVELIREALSPAVAYTAVVLAFGQITVELAEIALFRSVILKLIILWLLMRWVRAIIVPREIREVREDDVARFGLDLFAISERSSALLVRTIRVWLFYAVFSSIAMDGIEFLLGRGFAPHLLGRFLFWGQLILIYFLCWLWRDEIVNRFVQRLRTRAETSSTLVSPERVARFLKRHKDRIYAVLFLAVLAAYDLMLVAYGFARQRLIPQKVARRLETFVFRKRVELAQTTTGETPPIEDDSQRLPISYLDLLNPKRIVPIDLTVPLTDEIKTIEEALEGWSTHSAGGAVAIVAEYGMGKTTLLDQFEASLDKSIPVIRHQVERRLLSASDAARMVAGLFGSQAEDQHELVEQISAGERRIVLLDDCHLTFLRTIHGFEAFDVLLDIVTLTSDTVFWVLTFNRYAWEYLHRVYDRRHYFQAVITLDGMSDNLLQSMIELRNQSGAIQPDFRQLLVTDRSKNGKSSRYEVVKTAAGYYRLLTEYCLGNPSVGLHYWRRSLNPKPRGEMSVVLFQRPDDAVFKELNERELFALTAIAQHVSLTIQEIAQVVDVELGLCKLDVKHLTGVGLVDYDNGLARLSVSHMRQVLAWLKSSNLLYTH